MKKAIIYYFSGLIIMNIYILKAVLWIAPQLSMQYSILMQSAPLPHITSIALAYFWWPIVIIIPSIFFTIWAIIAKYPDYLYHIVIIFCFIDCIGLFLSLLGFLFPMMTITCGKACTVSKVVLW